LETGGRAFLVHHFYDKNHNGDPAVQVRPLLWDADGWPVAGEPMSQPINAPPPAQSPPAGVWQVDLDFANPSPMELTADQKIPGGGTWAVDGDKLHLDRPRHGRAAWTLDAFVAADGRSFVGRDCDGAVVRGRR
jgi:hypothetical protein